VVYQFKRSALSSHSVLLDSLPGNGSGRRVLDVGCGNGYLGAILTQRSYQVTGLEQANGFSDTFPASVELVVADLERGLPPLRDRYDFVLLADILEHLRSPEQLLAQVREVLAPGGVVLASLPNSGNIWFRGNVLLGRFPQEEKGLFDRTHIRFYMWKGWEKLFNTSGFRITSVRPTPIPFSAVVAGADTSLPVRAAENVCYGLALIWKALFAYQFVVRAQPVPMSSGSVEPEHCDVSGKI